MEFVFEEGDEGAGQLAEQLRKEQDRGCSPAGSVAIRPKGVAALQAADFAAYETTKQLVRTIGADERAMRRSLDVLLDKVPTWRSISTAAAWDTFRRDGSRGTAAGVKGRLSTLKTDPGRVSFEPSSVLETMS